MLRLSSSRTAWWSWLSLTLTSTWPTSAFLMTSVASVAASAQPLVACSSGPGIVHPRVIVAVTIAIAVREMSSRDDRKFRVRAFITAFTRLVVAFDFRGQDWESPCLYSYRSTAKEIQAAALGFLRFWHAPILKPWGICSSVISTATKLVHLDAKDHLQPSLSPSCRARRCSSPEPLCAA